MSKFKAGDRVVFIKGLSQYDLDLGKRAVVTKTIPEGVYILFDGEEDEQGFLWDYRFEFEELYDSPLAKVMREE